MATTLYLRDTKANGISVYRDALAAKGASLATGVVTTTASGSEIQWTKTAGGELMTFVSGRVPSGGVTLTGVTFNVWGKESGASVNSGFRAKLYKRATDGTETQLGGNFDKGTELVRTNRGANNWATGTVSYALLENERLIVRIYAIPAGGTMGAGTADIGYDAATGGSDGDSYITLTQTVTFKGEDQTLSGAGAIPSAEAFGTAHASTPQNITGAGGIASGESFDSTGYKLWAKADALVGLNDGDAVSLWSDLSAAGHHLTQSNYLYKPIYKTGILNGLPVVRFKPGGQPTWLSTDAFSFLQPSTIFIIGRSTGGSTTVLVGDLTGGYRRVFYSTNSTDFEVGDGAALIQAVSNMADYAVMGGVFNGAASVNSYNGTAVTGNAGTGNPAASGVMVGCMGGGSWALVGDIGEIIVCDWALSTSDRQRIEGYLAWRWGLQGSLPVGHPYKSSAPVMPGTVISLAQPQNVTAVGGIASSESFGTATVSTPQFLTASGAITSVEAFGVAKLNQRLTAAGGISSSEALGAAKLKLSLVGTGAVASAEVFGAAKLNQRVTDAGGIPSNQTLGAGKVTLSLSGVGGIYSSEAFGAATLKQSISGVGISSLEVFGAARVNQTILAAGGVASAEAFGTCQLNRNIVGAGGIASGESFGGPTLSPGSAGQNIFGAGGVGSAEAFGTSVFIYGQTISGVAGIPTGESWGVAQIWPTLGIAPHWTFKTVGREKSGTRQRESKSFKTESRDKASSKQKETRIFKTGPRPRGGK